MTNNEFTLMMFANEPPVITQAITAGIHNFMVDCEWRGKVERQIEADTDTSFVTLENVKDVVAIRDTIVSCRINAFGAWTDQEIEVAIESGASRIFLPMVRNMKEAEHFLQRINGRVRPAILVETDEAVCISSDLASLPFDSVYVGLNDLAISRGHKVIFESLLDGTVELLREAFQGVSFGFGGVTLLGCGNPIPVELLLAEMHRLKCNFSFLRRSYCRDMFGKDGLDEITKLQFFWRNLEKLDCASRNHQKQLLDSLISDLIIMA